MSADFFIITLLQGLGYAGLATGVYLSLRIFKIPDITTDGSFTLGGAVTVVMLTMHFHPLLTMSVAIIAGMLAGMATGLIITRLNIQPLLAGILTMTALYSINLAVMGRSNIPLIDTPDIYKFTSISDSTSAVAVVMILCTAAVVLKLYYFLRTDFGIALRATGSSEAMAGSLGVNTNSMKVMGLAIANGFTAFSGYLLTQYQGFADVNMGLGIVISGLGSVLIGEALFKKFVRSNILSTLLAVVAGSIIFRMIIAIALASGLNPNYLKLITAIIVLLIVGLSSRRRKND